MASISISRMRNIKGWSTFLTYTGLVQFVSINVSKLDLPGNSVVLRFTYLNSGYDVALIGLVPKTQKG